VIAGVVPAVGTQASPTGAERGPHPAAAPPGDGPVAPLQALDLATAEYGPGTRLVLFTAGCPLRCQYCCAPETWSARSGRPVSVGQVMAVARRYTPLFGLTGGGVTLSGGEPLLHPEFTAAVLRACRAEGMHTAVDTSGALGTRLDDAALADIDLTLLDLKAVRPDSYHRLTRGEVAQSLHFARRLARLGRPMQVRFVLVPGLTDGTADVAALADFVAGLGTVVERLDVVPFHRRGEAGWNALGLEFPLASRAGPTREALAAVRAAFRERGVPVG
jgi:pyruvate formate lyase activating enzyme